MECHEPLDLAARAGIASRIAMTKADLTRALLTQLQGFSKKEAAELVDLIFETMKEVLGRGEVIRIDGFGTFALRDKGRRQGRNPQTGVPMMLAERRVLSFKTRRRLWRALNALSAVAAAEELQRGNARSCR